MKHEEVKAYIQYAQANAGTIRKTCEIEQGVATIVGRSIKELYHKASHFTATRAFEHNGTEAVLFIRTEKQGQYIIPGYSPDCERTYVIDPKRLLEVYCSNEALRYVLLHGNYRYISGYLIKADSNAISNSGGLFVNNNIKDFEKDTIGFFKQDNVNNRLCFTVTFAEFDLKKQYRQIQKVTKTLGQRFIELLKIYGISNKDVSEKTKLPANMIDSIRNDRAKSRELHTMVKLCSGLDFPPRISYELFALAGVALNPTSLLNYAYEVIINTYCGRSIEEKEQLFSDNDLPPLFDEK